MAAVSPSTVLSSVCVAVIAPVIFGNVALMVDLMRRRWSSACARPSVDTGIGGVQVLMCVPVSSAMG